ncbi:MAG TPA: winged helix-turn-helix domain-containing protein [Nitrososphaera sp.]|nr:winged helix-turn-helix domain-containing protein [Nitrososphaera sp.]
MKNRSRDDILIGILSMLEEPQNKTFIMCRTHLSYTQLKTYLEFMIINGFVYEHEGKWKMTTKGRVYLNTLREVNQILNNNRVDQAGVNIIDTFFRE